MTITEKKFRYLHEEIGLTLEQLSKHFGVSLTTIWRHAVKYNMSSTNDKELEPREKKDARKFHQSEKCEEYMKDYTQSEHGKEVRKEYSQSINGKKAKEKYDNSYKGKEAISRHSHKRRGLEFIQYNKPSEGTVSHHIDKRHVINIPEDIHKSIYHNVWTGEGMEAINREAMDFLMYEIQEGIVLRG